MKPLTLDESIFLTAILVLEENAYGVKIRRRALEISGKAVSYGTLYSHLDQLFRKGYVTKAFGPPSPERGGRSKIYYRVSPSGRKALMSAIALQKSIWKAVPKALVDER